MDKVEIIARTRDYVRDTLVSDVTGHDWWHVYRVWQTAIHIAKMEGADLFITELAALLHDIADWKFHGGDINKGVVVASKWLRELNLEAGQITKVSNIIRDVSFKGAKVPENNLSLEAQVVQDADRLDAIGAIGIARTFSYGGFRGHALYDPNIEPTQHQSFSEYQQSNSPTINHFYEKLLLLKDRMKTVTGKQMAQHRHAFMEQFLQEFFNEWGGAE